MGSYAIPLSINLTIIEQLSQSVISSLTTLRTDHGARRMRQRGYNYSNVSELQITRNFRISTDLDHTVDRDSRTEGSKGESDEGSLFKRQHSILRNWNIEISADSASSFMLQRLEHDIHPACGCLIEYQGGIFHGLLPMPFQIAPPAFMSMCKSCLSTDPQLSAKRSTASS